MIFLSTTGDVLNDTQQAAFERYIRAGGGYAGIHSAADTEYGWPWYGKLVGAYFRNHPNGTPTATTVVEDTTDPSTAGIPARWTRADEWYNYQSPDNPVVNGGGNDYSPRNTAGVHVLLTMDESTYAEADGTDTRRRRPSDRLVPALRRRPLVVHGPRPHAGASFSDPTMLGHLRPASRSPRARPTPRRAARHAAGQPQPDGDGLPHAGGRREHRHGRQLHGEPAPTRTATR